LLKLQELMEFIKRYHVKSSVPCYSYAIKEFFIGPSPQGEKL